MMYSRKNIGLLPEVFVVLCYFVEQHIYQNYISDCMSNAVDVELWNGFKDLHFYGITAFK